MGRTCKRMEQVAAARVRRWPQGKARAARRRPQASPYLCPVLGHVLELQPNGVKLELVGLGGVAGSSQRRELRYGIPARHVGCKRSTYGFGADVSRGQARPAEHSSGLVMPSVAHAPMPLSLA